MFCAHCGKELAEDAVVCVACGRSTGRASLRAADSRQLPGPNYGIPALVLGIVCWFFSFWWLWPVGVVGAILAIVFGSMGISRRGRGLAVAGLALGGLFLSEILLSMCFGIAWLAAEF